MEAAHAWQLKFYILLLEQNGVQSVTGIKEYIKLKETKAIAFTEADNIYLHLVINRILKIEAGEQCLLLLQVKFCKSCSYTNYKYFIG